MIEACILDMDGVLVDTEGIHLEAFRIFLDEYSIPYDENFLHSLIGYSVDDNIRELKKEFAESLTLSAEQAIIKRNDIYLELIDKRELQPLPGVEPLLASCEKNNIKLALASSSERRQVEVVMTKVMYDFRKRFQAIVTGSDVERKKPAPDIYLLALEKLGVQAPSCIAVEDSPAGVNSAKSAGIFCYALKNNYVTEEKLSAADSIIHTLDEIRLD